VSRDRLSALIGGTLIALMSLPWFWHVYRTMGDARVYDAADLIFSTIVFFPGLVMFGLGVHIATNALRRKP
jgi:hypothetical protein